VHHEAVIATAMVVTATVPARVGTEEEAREEDHRDDEDHACDDADPGGHRGEAAVPWLLDDGGCWGRGFGGGHGAGRGFGGRRCFAHGLELAGDVGVPVLNQL
jgi:hypothetical protein